MEEIKTLLTQLTEQDVDRYFARPIRETLKGKMLQTYLNVVRQPMDFYTIESKMETRKRGCR